MYTLSTITVFSSLTKRLTIASGLRSYSHQEVESHCYKVSLKPFLALKTKNNISIILYLFRKK